MNKDLAHQLIAVVGYGITGRACVRFLLSKKAHVTVLDAKFDADALADTLVEEYVAEEKVQVAVLNNDSDLSNFDIIVLSPGVSPHQQCLQNYQAKGGKLIGDIELFSWFNTTPLIGITGSNGKTTVTDMLGVALEAAGLRVALAGNYGKGALDLLPTEGESSPYDYIVLELSSFQLEMTTSLNIEVAALLNVTEDHIDRHGTFEAYRDAKQAIFKNASLAVINVDESTSYPSVEVKSLKISAKNAIRQTDQDNQSIAQSKDVADLYINQKQEIVVKSNNVATVLLNRADIQLKGEHNLVNLLTVLAICQALNINLAKVANALSDYRGLAHRFEVVNTDTNAQWINDSKATNVGACLAALDCFEAHDYLVLIAGGDAKGANLQQLESALREKVNDLIVFGKDVSLFASLHENVYPVDSLAEAVAKASKCIHQKSDATVLLSPACASIDMFANYQARGDQFKALVTQLTTNGEAKAQAVNHG